MLQNSQPFIIALGDLSGDGLVRIPLAKIGKWFKGKIRFAITNADLAVIVQNFRKRKTGEVVIDFDHSTEYAAGSGQPVPAAGWLKVVEDGPDQNGVLWGMAEFTAGTLSMLRNRQYKYISPVIDWGARDRQTGEQQGATITSVALTNCPVLEEMPAIALSEAGEELDMITKIEAADGDFTKATVICEHCGKRTGAAVPQVVRLSDVPRTQDGRLDFSAVPTGKGILIASEVLRAHEASTALDGAIQAGKITPAQRQFFEPMALSDVAKFRSLVTTMKPQIPLSEVGFSGTGEETSTDPVRGQINILAQRKMERYPELTYGQAVKLVASENPELAQQYRISPVQTK